MISKEKFAFIKDNKEALNIIIDPTRTRRFEFFGLRTVYDRYLLKDPKSRDVIETPQYFFLRVACGLAKNFEEAKEFYELTFIPLTNAGSSTDGPFDGDKFTVGFLQIFEQLAAFVHHFQKTDTGMVVFRMRLEVGG